MRDLGWLTIIAAIVLGAIGAIAWSSESTKAQIAVACVSNGGEWVREYGSLYECRRGADHETR